MCFNLESVNEKTYIYMDRSLVTLLQLNLSQGQDSDEKRPTLQGRIYRGGAGGTHPT
jgi:hypothetical protein